MKILLATGIYPPEVGGPAEYARGLEKAFRKDGHEVSVRAFRKYRCYPSGIRHFFYFLYLLYSSSSCEIIIALDTFSVGLPAVLVGLLTNIPVIVRTGGDFLWEGYIERTGEKILFSDFYTKPRSHTLKENLIFMLTKRTLQHAEKVVFSTKYQRDVFIPAYGLDPQKTTVIENFYPPHTLTSTPNEKRFVCFVRNLKWKSLDTLRRAFDIAQEKRNDIVLDVATDIDREELLTRLQNSYAAILVSLGDISPNFILETLSYEKPFILTTETGLKDRLKDVAIFADPLDVNDIAKKILWLSSDKNYAEQKKKLEKFAFTHIYEEIAGEFLASYQNL